MPRMSQCVRRTKNHDIQEETESQKKFQRSFRQVLSFRSGNRGNERTSSIPAPRPGLRRYFFQSAQATRLYQINEHLHTGWDSEIYVGERRTDSKKVVIKVSQNSQALEAQRHRALIDDDEPVGVPCIYSYERCEDSQKTYLITEYLGLSLYDVLERLENRRMRVKDVCMIAVRVIACLKYFHKKGVVHGDINPKIILTGRLDKRSEMFLVDYKSLQPWGHKGNQIPCEETRTTMRNSHYGAPRSWSSHILTRRDDMISFSYTIIELLKGELPWVTRDEINGSRRLDRMKKEVGKGVSVCADLPKEIVDFVKMVHALGYTESPDYSALSELFTACLRRIGATDDNLNEWFKCLGSVPEFRL